VENAHQTVHRRKKFEERGESQTQIGQVQAKAAVAGGRGAQGNRDQRQEPRRGRHRGP